MQKPKKAYQKRQSVFEVCLETIVEESQDACEGWEGQDKLLW